VSDRFVASYLSHEAQHWADYKSFPRLEQTDLEYRAKLAELVAFKRPKRRLEYFRSEANNDPRMPHCFAAFHIVERMDELMDQKDMSISESAKLLLCEHTEELKKIGAKKVASALLKKGHSR
jgi:hypothetical protein